MMAKDCSNNMPITALVTALDACKTLLCNWVNGDENTTVNLGGVATDSIRRLVLKFNQYGGILGRDTLAELQADLNWPDGKMAIVTNDPNPANNGYYDKEGASGAGYWHKAAYDPTQAARDVEKIFGSITAGNLYPDRAGDYLSHYTRAWQTPITGLPAGDDPLCRVETMNDGKALVTAGDSSITPRSIVSLASVPSAAAVLRMGPFAAANPNAAFICGVVWYDSSGAYLRFDVLYSTAARYATEAFEYAFHVRDGAVVETSLSAPEGAAYWTPYARFTGTTDYYVSHLFVIDLHEFDAALEYFHAQLVNRGMFFQVPDIVDGDRQHYAQAVVDGAGYVGYGLTDGGDFTAGGIKLQRTTDTGYALSILDEDFAQAFGITTRGQVAIGNAMHVSPLDSLPDGSPYNIADEEGYVAIKVEHDGSVTAGGVTRRATQLDDYALAIADVDGYVALGITKDGYVEFFGGPKPPESNGLLSLAFQRADIIGAFPYGQSLARGGHGTPALSVSQPYDNIMFLSGVMTRSMDSDADFSDVAALVEAEQETPTSGALNRLSELIAASGDASEWQFLGAAPGQGNTRIQELSRGTIYWSGMMEQITAAVAVATAKSESFNFWAIFWAQGEANYAAGTSRESYKAMLIQLKEDLAGDVHAITKQVFKSAVVTYQVASHRVYGRRHNDIAIAQWQASKDDPDIIMAMPMYHLPYSDVQHLTNDGYVQMGRYYARALFETYKTGIKFRPLEPDKMQWAGRIIDIEMHVPVGDLMVDTTLVAEAPNHGFDIWATATDVDTSAIASVEIAPGNRVRIRLSRDPVVGDLLTYARGRPGDPATSGPVDGPRGNLRDQAGDADNYTDSQGVTRYMHNWLVMFEKAYK
jgi:hypothetical protein